MRKTATEHLYEERHNNQGCLMKIVEYKKRKDIFVEFQDEHKARVHTTYDHFTKGLVKNPYYPALYGVGAIGNKYPVSENCKPTKEYAAWRDMLRRCYDADLKKRNPTYQDVICCDEWHLFENFYEWLHNQENFDKWYNSDKWEWAVDKDILVKGNQIYSPNACCLVPQSINQLFKRKHDDGAFCINLQINLSCANNEWQIKYQNPFTDKAECLTSYQDIEIEFQKFQKYKMDIIEQEFQKYKMHKENNIKQVAQTEYDKGNITEQCYETMMNYNIEINDFI